MEALSGVRAVLIEDEAQVAFLIEAMLADLGCEPVGVAARVSEALALIAATSFDVALLDLNLAGELSYPVADQLAAQGKPFVFVTGYGPSGLPPQHRAVPVVTKPFRGKDIAEALCMALGADGPPRAA